MATNYDLRPQRKVIYGSPVFTKDLPLLKYEGHNNNLIKMFVLAWAKFKVGVNHVMFPFHLYI